MVFFTRGSDVCLSLLLVTSEETCLHLFGRGSRTGGLVLPWSRPARRRVHIPLSSRVLGTWVFPFPLSSEFQKLAVTQGQSAEEVPVLPLACVRDSGQWQDPGVELIPNITTLRGTEEPPFHRVPLEQWDEARGLVSHVHWNLCSCWSFAVPISGQRGRACGTQTCFWLYHSISVLLPSPSLPFTCIP